MRHFPCETKRVAKDNANVKRLDCLPETAVPPQTAVPVHRLYYQRTQIQPAAGEGKIIQPVAGDGHSSTLKLVLQENENAAGRRGWPCQKVFCCR